MDDLLDNSYSNLSILDLSAAALSVARERLGQKAEQVAWLEANVLEAEFPEHAFDVWHDRAVFHFLTTQEQRQAYVKQVFHAVKPGGLVIVATFAEDGPMKCSGLPVMRYSPNELQAKFSELFDLQGYVRESHYTPAGDEQKFVYCCFRKVK